MSQKTDLQSNNTDLQAILNTINNLPEASSGEDVTAETTAYTTKLASLETAIAALETELAGKASGGSGGSVETCTVSILDGESRGNITFVCATVCDGNSLSSYVFTYDGITYDLTIENVVCNSGLVVGVSGYGSGTEFVLNGAEVIASSSVVEKAFCVTAKNGETVTIQYCQNDDK